MKQWLIRFLGTPPILFARRLVSDSTLDLDRKEAEILGLTKLSRRSLYGDRFLELRRYWKANTVHCLWFFMRKGFPFSKRIRNTLMDAFDGHTGPGELIESYRRTAFHYAAYLMLAMHRGQWLIPFLADIRSGLDGLDGKHVLDYGCGVSDIGLTLGRLGMDVTIADLDTERLQFARWRYTVRGIDCDPICIRDTECSPSLPRARFDAIVATEVLEHVRDPLALLTAFTDSLKPGGVLFCSSGSTLDREVGGDHLAESIKAGNDAAYQRFFEEHYQSCALREGRQWLFVKTSNPTNND